MVLGVDHSPSPALLRLDSAPVFTCREKYQESQLNGEQYHLQKEGKRQSSCTDTCSCVVVAMVCKPKSSRNGELALTCPLARPTRCTLENQLETTQISRKEGSMLSSVPT